MQGSLNRSPNPYFMIGGSILGGAGAGFLASALQKLPEITTNQDRSRSLTLDGFHYREATDKDGKVASVERKAVQADIKPFIREANPDVTLTFGYRQVKGGKSVHLAKQLDVTLPTNKTYHYTIEEVENGKPKSVQKKGTLAGELQARYVSPLIENDVVDLDSKAPKPFKLGLQEFQHRVNDATTLKAVINPTAKELTYEDVSQKPSATKTLELSNLNHETPHLFLDLRETLATHVSTKELEKDKKTGRSNADAYQRVSTPPIDSKQYTWHPTAVEKLETRFEKALKDFNAFKSLEAVQNHKRLAVRTSAMIVGSAIGLTLGVSAWCYSKYKERHKQQGEHIGSPLL